MSMNLERAAAIVAERGGPLVETYRGWEIWAAVEGEPAWSGVCPHEMNWRQVLLVLEAALFPGLGGHHLPTWLTGPPLLAAPTWKLLRETIDRWEAAREAMPASAWFDVPEEVEAL